MLKNIDIEAFKLGLIAVMRALGIVGNYNVLNLNVPACFKKVAECKERTAEEVVTKGTGVLNSESFLLTAVEVENIVLNKRIVLCCSYGDRLVLEYLRVIVDALLDYHLCWCYHLCRSYCLRYPED